MSMGPRKPRNSSEIVFFRSARNSWIFEVIKAKIKCHRKGLREEEVCSFGLEKGPRELLLELGTGSKQMKQNHLDLQATKWA